MCDSLEGQLDDSVVISNTDPAVEGATVTVMFHCPVSFSLICMENGEWEPAPYKVNCSGQHNINLTPHNYDLYMS